MRTLYLHIGTHKTGTKSFQAWLLDHRAQLRARRVAICTETSRSFGEVANCFAFANATLRPTLITQARMTGHARPAGPWRRALMRARLARTLADPAADRFILSAEALCFAREPDELARLRYLLRTDLEIVPVVCLRDLAGWRESWSAYLTRSSAGHRRDHGSGTDDIRGDWYFDPPAILSFWQRLGPVRTVDYDSAVARDGSVIPALLAAMDLPADEGAGRYFLNTRAA